MCCAHFYSPVPFFYIYLCSYEVYDDDGVFYC